MSKGAKSGLVNEIRRNPARSKNVSQPPAFKGMTEQSMRRLVREMHIRQGQLEEHNKELLAAQTELATSRDRYSDLYNLAPVGYLTLDVKGRILESNRTASALLGIPRKTLLRTNFSALVSSRSEAEWQLYRAASFSGETRRVSELELQKPGAGSMYVRLETIPVDFEADRRCRMSIIDISERKLAERALRESERRFRDLADHAPVMIRMTGADKGWVWFNKPWLEFTGRTMEQELGRGWEEDVHPDDVANCRKVYDAAFGVCAPFSMEYRRRRCDGEWRWLVCTGVPRRCEDGTFAGYMASSVDVSELRQTGEALRERQDYLRSILNAAADAIITYDQNGTIVSVNPATELMFGYKRDELVGCNVASLMLARPDADGNTPAASAGSEMTGIRKDGTEFAVDLSVSSLSRGGLVTGVARDVSKRKETELQLDQYRKDLRTMSLELMLAEERERQRLAQDLHDGLGQALFRARMKLAETKIAGPAARSLSDILEDIAKMVNTLTFELSPPILRQLGFGPAVRWLADDMKQRYGLTVQVEGSRSPLSLDENISLVAFRTVRELLVNVAKHAGVKFAAVSIRKAGSLKVTVQDEGAGFDVAVPARSVEHGHFGLFSIRERLEYFGGAFKIESRPGAGTRASFTVPFTGRPAKS